MSKISHNEVKRTAVVKSPTTTNETGKLYESGGVYKVWTGREFLNLGAIDTFQLYDNVASFPTIGVTGLLYLDRVTNYVYSWDGVVYNKAGNRQINNKYYNYNYGGTINLLLGTQFRYATNGAETLAFSNQASAAASSGKILLVNTSSHVITLGSNILAPSGFAAAMSVTGTYMVDYICDGTDVYLVASVALV